jgi:hypothetical protein
MFRLIDAEPTDLPPVEHVDVLVVLGDRHHPQAAEMIKQFRTERIGQFFMAVTSRRTQMIVPLATERDVLDAAARLGALPEETIEPGAIVEVHALLAAPLARRAQEAAAAAALAATAAEGSA